MIDSRTRRDRTFLYWGIASVVFFCGLLVILELGQWSWIKGDYKAVTEKLIEALIVASALAISVDTYFKKRLARDAFEASIGYILPEYLKDELSAIYTSQIICNDHSQTVKISPIEDSDFVLVRVSVERTLENISKNNAAITPNLALDEWFSPKGESEFVGTGYTINGGAEKQYSDAICDESGFPSLVKKSETIILKPGDTIRIWNSFKEIKQRNDQTQLTYGYATNRPRVRVFTPDDIDWYVRFTHRAEVIKQKFTGEVVLSGLLLPNQVVFVRWWDKAKLKVWVQNKK